MAVMENVENRSNKFVIACLLSCPSQMLHAVGFEMPLSSDITAQANMGKDLLQLLAQCGIEQANLQTALLGFDVLDKRFVMSRACNTQTSTHSCLRTKACDFHAFNVLKFCLSNAALAQLVEQLLRKEKVNSSIPLSGTTSFHRSFGIPQMPFFLPQHDL